MDQIRKTGSRALAALAVGGAMVAVVGAAGVSGSSATTARPHAAAMAHRALGPDHQVWLCKPSQAVDPCKDSMTATAVTGTGHKSIQHASVAKHPKVDCFYVYPTVSGQPTINANLHIDPEETFVAVAQASRYSQVCRMFAPMYRQITVAGLINTHTSARNFAIAFDGVLAAWKDYLARYNHGRGVVLIGHSQGAGMLTRLIQSQIDRNPAERKLVVSAILMGGNVLVPKGKDVGGAFKHIAACHADSETGCVIAFSSFNHHPPANSFFGRTTVRGMQVLCTNPAALGGGAGPDTPYFPTHLHGLFQVGGAPKGVSTPWVTYPKLFSSRCMDSGGASWLQINDIRKPGDTRPKLVDSLGPLWGLHLYDGNIALGNLVDIVRAEAAAYTAAS